MRKIASVLLVSIALAGCARSGTKVDPEALKSFESGKTTYGEVVKELGTPNNVALLPDGRQYVQYIYFESQVRPETMIPYVGPFVGGVDTSGRTVTLIFDDRGVLQRSGSGESYVPTTMGVGDHPE